MRSILEVVLCPFYVLTCSVEQAPWLGIQPSFMLGGAIPATFIATHYLVEALPAVPMPGLYNELLCAVVDAFTRALLLCNVVPTVVTKHASPLISTSPWTLLITALVSARFHIRYPFGGS